MAGAVVEPTVLALVGPTAAGKSEIALDIARRLGAEIVGADSRQVYRRLDIGSAKPSAAERALAPHHLIDVAEPAETFNCARYRELALAAIADIQRRGRRVLVVGGTGLYLKVLRHGLASGPRADADLRRRLEAAEAAEPGVLHRRLQEVDPATAGRLHPNDRVRLVRALEVHALTGRAISDWQRRHAFAAGGVAMRVVGLDVEREVLADRIEARADAMLRAGLSPELAALRSPGYAEIGAHVRGLCTLAEARVRMIAATRRLAKRQRTWLRGHPPDAVVAPGADAVLAAFGV
jgi:tRNA dimethylallyltransferase